MNEYWNRDEFPRQIIDAMRPLDLLRRVWNEDGTRKADATVMEGIITLEACKVDVSTAVFFGVHAGLAFASVALGGSAEQKAEWLPKMLDLKAIGAFGLTEPEGGSQVSRGLRTTCRRDGDAWVLNGQKKWIGNSTFSDFTVIWARDEEQQRGARLHRAGRDARLRGREDPGQDGAQNRRERPDYPDGLPRGRHVTASRKSRAGAPPPTCCA